MAFFKAISPSEDEQEGYCKDCKDIMPGTILDRMKRLDRCWSGLLVVRPSAGQLAFLNVSLTLLSFQIVAGGGKVELVESQIHVTLMSGGLEFLVWSIHDACPSSLPPEGSIIWAVGKVSRMLALRFASSIPST